MNIHFSHCLWICCQIDWLDGSNRKKVVVILIRHNSIHFWNLMLDFSTNHMFYIILVRTYEGSSKFVHWNTQAYMYIQQERRWDRRSKTQIDGETEDDDMWRLTGERNECVFDLHADESVKKNDIVPSRLLTEMKITRKGVYNGFFFIFP